jgi:hypothetical protein
MVENNVGPSTAAVTVTASRCRLYSTCLYASILFCFSKRKGASLALIKPWRIYCVSVESYRIVMAHCLLVYDLAGHEQAEMCMMIFNSTNSICPIRLARFRVGWIFARSVLSA